MASGEFDRLSSVQLIVRPRLAFRCCWHVPLAPARGILWNSIRTARLSTPRLRCPIGKSHERRSNGSGVRCGLGVWDTPIEIDVQQRADSGTKSGLNRTPLDDQKVIKVNDLAAFGLLATDQKVRSSNLFGRAILSMT